MRDFLDGGSGVVGPVSDSAIFAGLNHQLASLYAAAHVVHGPSGRLRNLAGFRNRGVVPNTVRTCGAISFVEVSFRDPSHADTNPHVSECELAGGILGVRGAEDLVSPAGNGFCRCGCTKPKGRRSIRTNPLLVWKHRLGMSFLRIRDLLLSPAVCRNLLLRVFPRRSRG